MKIPVEVIRLGPTVDGGGLRTDEGKTPFQLLPLSSILGDHREGFLCSIGSPSGIEYLSAVILWEMAQWQAGEDLALDLAWDACVVGAESPVEVLKEMGAAAKVLQVNSSGKAAKYPAWNWARGMSWSTCLGCIVRHCLKIIVDGEAIDGDSGETHLAHIQCNLLFLREYRTSYPEGDDRPGALLK